MKRDGWQKHGKGVFSMGNILQTEWKLNAYDFFSPAVLDPSRDLAHEAGLEEQC